MKCYLSLKKCSRRKNTVFIFILIQVFLALSIRTTWFIYLLFICLTTKHKALFFIFCLPFCLFVSICKSACLCICKYVLFLLKYLPVSNSLSMLVCLFVCLAATPVLSLYSLGVFIALLFL